MLPSEYRGYRRNPSKLQLRSRLAIRHGSTLYSVTAVKARQVRLHVATYIKKGATDHNIYYFSKRGKRICNKLCLITLYRCEKMSLQPSQNMKLPVLAIWFLWLSFATADSSYPSNINIRAAVIPGETFGGFQRDLLSRIEVLALQDNVTLKFKTNEVQTVYGDNLALLSAECQTGETVVINDVEYGCDDYDMIVGDFWTSPEYVLDRPSSSPLISFG